MVRRNLGLNEWIISCTIEYTLLGLANLAGQGMDLATAPSINPKDTAP